MSEKTDVWQGTLALMALKTLEALGPLHGYGIARRIEQISENKEVLAVNDLGEECYATPAIADDRIYIRTQDTLYSLGRAAEK